MNQSVLPGITLPPPSLEDLMTSDDFLFSDDFGDGPPSDSLSPHPDNQCLLPGFHRADTANVTGDSAGPNFAQTTPNPIIVIGLGMGETPLSAEAARHLREAEVLALPRRLLSHFRGHTAQLITLASPLKKALQKLEDAQERGRRCVVLADGDPLLYGIGATLSKRPSTPLRIVPGVSAMQTACARVSLPWHDVATVSLHGRDTWLPLAHATLTARPICVYTDTDHHPGIIAQFLLDRGVDWFRMIVAEHLSSPHERLRDLSLPEAAHQNFDGGETVLLLPNNLTPRGPRLGLDESTLVTDAGLYTKAPVRAAALSLLSLSPDAVMWDIGAGSGAVALEAAALVSRGQVWAVEQNPERVRCIVENRRRIGIPHLEILSASAPQALKNLPDPDAIFVGGGLGNNATKLLTSLLSRLKPNGTLVGACTLLSSLNAMTALLEKRQIAYSVSLIQASRSAPLADSLTLKPINPIFLIKISL